MEERNHATEIAKELYYLESTGTGDHVGSEYGGLLQSELKEAVGRSGDALARRFGARQIERAVGQMSDSYRKAFPYLWIELDAVSRAAAVPLLELEKHLFAAGVGAFGDNGCSNVIFPRSDVGPLLGKTHDATSPEPGKAVVRLIRLARMNTVLCVARIDGFSVMTGLNDRGLAIGEASIHFSWSNRSGTIRNLLLRPLLHECGTVADGVEFLATHPPLSAGFQFSMVDASGNAAIVERSPTDQTVRWSQGEPVFCTNHAATPSVRVREMSRGPEGDRNSDVRYENLRQLTGAENFLASLDSMEQILRFHDANGGICQHGDPEYRGERQEFYPMFTQRAFINLVGPRKLLVANGNPCQSEFLEFSVH